MSGGYCPVHQRGLNAEGWCDECGEPVAMYSESVTDAAMEVWMCLKPSHRDLESRLTTATKGLEVIRDLPSEYDLLTNAVARAMYEYAIRALAELSSSERR